MNIKYRSKIVAEFVWKRNDEWKKMNDEFSDQQQLENLVQRQWFTPWLLDIFNVNHYDNLYESSGGYRGYAKFQEESDNDVDSDNDNFLVVK